MFETALIACVAHLLIEAFLVVLVLCAGRGISRGAKAIQDNERLYKEAEECAESFREKLEVAERHIARQKRVILQERGLAEAFEAHWKDEKKRSKELVEDARRERALRKAYEEGTPPEDVFTVKVPAVEEGGK